MTDFAKILHRLSEHQVRFILVGGLAATVHGSARLTQDIDLVYDRDDENLDRLVAALDPLDPYLRGAPPGLPFEWSRATLERGLNFTLTTAAGDIDLLGDIPGGGSFRDLLPHTVVVELFQAPCLCLDLPALVRTKRAAGRPKDLEALAELEVLMEEMAGRSPESGGGV